MENKTTYEHLKETSILRLITSTWEKGDIEDVILYPQEDGFPISVQVLPVASLELPSPKVARFQMFKNEGDFLIDALTKVARNASSEGISKGDDLFSIPSNCPYDTILTNVQSFHLFRGSMHFSPEVWVENLKKGNMGVLRGATVWVNRCVPHDEIFMVNKSSLFLEEVSPFSEEITEEYYKVYQKVRLHFTSPDVVRLKVA